MVQCQSMKREWPCRNGYSNADGGKCKTTLRGRAAIASSDNYFLQDTSRPGAQVQVFSTRAVPRSGAGRNNHKVRTHFFDSRRRCARRIRRNKSGKRTSFSAKGKSAIVPVPQWELQHAEP